MKEEEIALLAFYCANFPKDKQQHAGMSGCWGWGFHEAIGFAFPNNRDGRADLEGQRLGKTVQL